MASSDASRDERWQEIVASEDHPASAIHLLKEYVRDYPEASYAWHRLGRTLTDLSRFDEAAAAFETALSLARPTKRLFVYGSLGDMFRAKGDDAAAESSYRAVIDDSPDDAQGYILLGAMFARRGRFPEAEGLYREAINCAQGCIDEAWHNLGLVLRAMERFDEAQDCFERALGIDPQYKDATSAMRDVRRAIRLRATAEQAP